jgi:hypothetical protein
VPRRLDPDARPDADRAVLEPADLGAWNQIAQTAALAHHGTLSQNASTFAALDLTLADSVIAFYDAKYAYHVWRPVTAIPNADADGNPDTAGDPNWTPLSATAPDPSYPGAHGRSAPPARTSCRPIYGNDFAFTVTSPAFRRRALVRELLRGG